MSPRVSEPFVRSVDGAGDTLALIRRNQSETIGSSFLTNKLNQFGGQVYNRSNSTLENFSTLMGYNAIASGNRSVAIGGFSLAQDDGSISLGVYANSNFAGGTIAIGFQAKTEAFGALSVGAFARSSYQQGIALGRKSWANGPTGIAIGANAISETDTAGQPSGISIGADSIAVSNSSIAIGVLAEVQAGTYAGIAIGVAAIADGGDYAISIGGDSIADGAGAIAVGGSSLSDGTDSVVIGESAVANSDFSVVIGADAINGTAADNSVVIGDSASSGTGGLNCVVLGGDAVAGGGDNAIVIGWAADSSTFSNCASIGAINTASNQFFKGFAGGGEYYSDETLAIGDNGQLYSVKALSELTTIAAAATTDTAITIPLDAVVKAVMVRVTTAIPTAATFTVTGTTSTTIFNTVAVSTAANSTDKGTAASGYYNYVAQTIRITPDLTPAANTGRVRVTIVYEDYTAPTS